ncbi:uncharacterized protein BCR38DRAFT_418974 [Pseudomassariella vexata]|uniref:DUF676 domain-containing protein n=1 Tax=Pseudomassariella vexata TaxID=1141098 RepID=A0A1Y2ELE6_9PEZI|nr:uncharacterized protein BCR38DRAFT_418974 [Pseudomassariella vexata]ORY72124.1 hypothetical protein BCR38DRAFT_418974 [Pseudomassariella vexata]
MDFPHLPTPVAIDQSIAVTILVLLGATIIWLKNKFDKRVVSALGRQIPADQSHQTSRNRPSLEVLYASPSITTTREVEVDVVAVHGLGANVDWSWISKHGAKPVHWLKDPDMLPIVVPNARIIVYNYDSRWHSDAPQNRLQLCGEGLVAELHRFRGQDNTRRRPIIFVGHSLCGLVILYALLYADCTEDFKYLSTQTVGFAALGTPFRGTQMQSLAKKVAWILDPTGSHLEQDGKHLEDKVHDFGVLRGKLAIPTCCLIELYVSNYGKKVKLPGLAGRMVVEEESAHIPGWARVFLKTDHFNLNKFEGPNDRSFLSVSEEIQKMCREAKSVLERR